MDFLQGPRFQGLGSDPGTVAPERQALAEVRVILGVPVLREARQVREFHRREARLVKRSFPVPLEAEHLVPGFPHRVAHHEIFLKLS